MFGLFKKKTELEKLQGQYKKLMKDAFDLSKTNRSESDTKYAEAVSYTHLTLPTNREV